MSDVITLVTAPAGSGKSWSRVRQLVEEILPTTEAHVYTNLPLFVEKIADHLAERMGCSAEDIADRIHLIPAEEISRWRLGTTGPWEFFKESDLDGNWLIIDEAHEVISKKGHNRRHKAEWQRWLGQIRHRGCRVQLISQHVEKIAQEIQDEAGLRIELANVETSRDPFFKIKVGDWYELKAKFFTGDIRPCVWEIERPQVDGKFRISDSHRWLLKSNYFQFYDSYSAPEHGGKKAEAPKREFQRRGRLSLIGWFLKRNWWRLGRAVAIGGLMVALPFLVPALVDNFMKFAGKDKREKAAASERSVASTEAPAVLLPKPPALSTQGKGKPMPGDENGRPTVKPDTLQGITEADAVFLEAGRIQVGELIDVGSFKGRRVVLLDWKHRGVTLDDGTVLRVGRGTVVPDWQAAGENSAGAVQRPVRTDRQAGNSGEGATASAKTGDVKLLGNEHDRIQQIDGGPGGGLGRVGRKLR